MRSKGLSTRSARKEKSVERNEHFIDTSTGMTIYTIEKKLNNFSPSSAALLIHGAGVGCACWDLDTKDYSLMELLAQEGFDVFAVDQRGYGRSTKPSEPNVTSEASASDLKSVIDFIRKHRHIEKVNIVGHSFGGMVAVYLTGMYPECVEKIVLMASPYKAINPSFQPLVDIMIGMAHNGIPYAPNKHHLTLEETLYSCEQGVIDTYKGLIDQSYPELPTSIFLDLKSLEGSKYIPDITAPTLLINGALEYVVAPDDAVHCLNDLGAKQKALLVIGNAYHLVFLEEIAHRTVNQAVLDWLLS